MSSEPRGPGDPAPASPGAGGSGRPTGRPTLLGPSRLRPVELDLTRVFWVGVLLWSVAAVVTGALAVAGQVEWRTVTVCCAGLGLGLLGVLWARRRRAKG